MQEAKDRYKTESSSILSFASQYVMRGDGVVKFKDLYERYQRFCFAEGYGSCEKKREFRKRLEESGYRIETSTKNNNSLCVFGVTIGDEREE